MPENLLTLLNYLLLALLYLFFARVLWAVWSEVRTARSKASATAAPPPGAVITRPPTAPRVTKASKTTKVAKRDRKKGKTSGPATQLVVTEPADRAGAVYPLGAEMSIGRAAGCHVQVSSDSFASNLHARIYPSEGLTMVEDLGSTNGTFVNGARIGGPTAVRGGDRVQVGSTVLEVQ